MSQYHKLYTPADSAVVYTMVHHAPQSAQKPQIVPPSSARSAVSARIAVRDEPSCTPRRNPPACRVYGIGSWSFLRSLVWLRFVPLRRSTPHMRIVETRLLLQVEQQELRAFP